MENKPAGDDEKRANSESALVSPEKEEKRDEVKEEKQHVRALASEIKQNNEKRLSLIMQTTAIKSNVKAIRGEERPEEPAGFAQQPTSDLSQKERATQMLIHKEFTTLLATQLPYLAKADQELTNMKEGYRLPNNFKMFIRQVNIVLRMSKTTMEKYGRKNMQPALEPGCFEVAQAFCVSRRTKLTDLKREACTFWNLEANEFELFEKGHILQMRYDETVEIFFYSTIEAQRAGADLVLQVPDRTKLYEPEDEEGDGAKNGKRVKREEKELTEINRKSREHQERRQKALAIERKYPGLRKYTYDGKKYQDKDLGINNHVIAFVVLTIMLAFSVAILVERRNVMNQYLASQSIQNILTKVSVTRIAFDSVLTRDNFWSFANGTFTDLILDPDSDIRQSSKVVGPVRIRMKRVKSKECSRTFINMSCYERIYSGSTSGTEILDFVSSAITVKYLSKSQSGQSYSVTGDLGTYSGGGLVVDIPNTQTKVQIQATLAALQTAGFVSMATRAMILEWTMYNPSLQQFSYCRVLFEFSPFGFTNPAHIYVRSFRFELKSSSKDDSMVSIDYVRLILCFYFLIVNIPIVARKYGVLLNLLTIMEILTNLFVFCISIVIFTYNVELSGKDEQEYATQQTFVTSLDEATKYEEIYILEAILFMFVVYKFLSVFRRYAPLQFVMTSIERAGLYLLAYIVMVFPCIVAYSIISFVMWGGYFFEYTTIIKSLLMFFMMCVGRTYTVYITNTNQAFGVFYIILSYLFALHFIVVSFIAIYLGAFKATLDAYGYPGDERMSKKWGIRDLVKWVVSCLPERWLVKLNLQEALTSTVRKKRQLDPEEKAEERKEEAVAAPTPNT